MPHAAQTPSPASATLALVVALTLAARPAVAQQPTQPPAQQLPPAVSGLNVKVTPTTVTRLTLVDVKPGMRAAFDQDVLENSIPIWEEFKKAGIITGYQIFGNTTTESPTDWDVGFALTYANWAALDNIADRTDPITLRHFGSAERRQAAAERRAQIGTTVSSRLMRTLQYSRKTTTAAR